jgi:exosortase A-associated hydrolase 1
MTYSEDAFVFECHGHKLVAIVTQPSQCTSNTGLLVVVGGPQYRVGSHRQFVELSRVLAENGVHCMRFDCRGMGDAEGDTRNFTEIHDDIAAAVDAFLERCPGLTNIVLWGLCDGATAAAFYAPTDERISGLILLNPWVHTEQVKAKTYLRHYYVPRIFSAAFWRKLLQGEFDPRPAARGALRIIKSAITRNENHDGSQEGNSSSLSKQLHDSLTHLGAETLILLSGKDLVAQEFETLIDSDDGWSRITKVVSIERFPRADHTFSNPEYARQAIEKTTNWVSRL